MAKVIAYHVVFCTHGFWLPNDPRGSWSEIVRSRPLRHFGPATKTDTRRSVAGRPHDRALRQAAKSALVLPEVELSGLQAASIANGFAEQVRTSGFHLFACSILPQHTHLVIGRHHFPIEQVVRLLRQAGTRRLLADSRHPFAELRVKLGRLPSIWAQDFWKVFLFNAEEVRREVDYVESNPIKEGKPRQHWSFVQPFAPTNFV